MFDGWNNIWAKLQKKKKIIIIFELKDWSAQCMKTMIDLDKKKKRNTFKTNIMTDNVGCYGYSPLVLIHLSGGLDTPVYSEKNNIYYDMGMYVAHER